MRYWLGDTEDYGNLLQLALNTIELPEHPDTLILPAHAGSKPAIGLIHYLKQHKFAPVLM